MDAIGLNPIKLDAIGLDPIRMNAIRLGVPGASSDSARPYIDPELLSHVKMAISTWGKSNDDPDRAVLKDLSGNGNDMRLLNFGFAGNSGYGLYSTNFSDWNKPSVSDFIKYLTNNSFYVINSDSSATKRVIYQNTSSSTPDIKGFKIKVEIIKGGGYYRYFDNAGYLRFFPIQESGIYELPTSYSSAMSGEDFIGFTIDANSEYKLEQLPDFEGWICTDGVDDIIESVKPVSEMLEGSNEITVVSIIHQISQIPGSEVNKGLNNQISYYDSPTTIGYLRNNVKDVGKTGIYGYTFNGTAHSVINNILGDKGDYIAVRNNEGIALNGVFSVCGYKNYYGELKELSSVAYAGGFIANKVLTTDEINQIIAYFNLDRPGQIIKPQLYCNVKKQGITNDNHAEFNDQLIDFVGGHNIQLNNISWEGESGINSYPVVFGANKTWNVIRANDGIDWRYTLLANKITIYKIETSNKSLIYSYVHTASGSNSMTVPAFKIKVDGLKAEESIIYDYISSDNTARSSRIIIRDNGLYDLPVSVPIQVTEITPASVLIGFTIALNDNVSKEGLTIEVLPTIENALCLDGISDFGKATGLPILKDYTVVADRKILGNNEGGTLSKSYSAGNGAFIFETGSVIYSFGTGTSGSGVQSKRMLSYLSKYIYNGNPVQAGAGIDSDSMWLGTLRDNDARFAKLALRSLLLFHYSLSEFLLERQLRKYNAGTLYPGMVEFRPIVKSNIPYLRILYFITPTGDQIIKGSYIPIGSVIQINIQTVNATDEISSVSVNGKEVDMYNKDETYWRYRFKATKSPQKISIVISSYLTMLGNDTLINNETLIKNE